MMMMMMVVVVVPVAVMKTELTNHYVRAAALNLIIMAMFFFLLAHIKLRAEKNHEHSSEAIKAVVVVIKCHLFCEPADFVDPFYLSQSLCVYISCEELNGRESVSLEARGGMSKELPFSARVSSVA